MKTTGPVERKKIWLSCEECRYVQALELKKTKMFPNIGTKYYCTKLEGSQVAHIRKYPKTPKWCPVLKERNENDNNQRRNKTKHK